MPLLGYVPIVLDGTVLADGYGAQILEILQILATDASPPVSYGEALPRLYEPRPSRKGHMKVVLGFQNGDDGESPPVVSPIGLIVVRLRSPFVNDNGNPTFAPTVSTNFGSGELEGTILQARYSTLNPFNLSYPDTLIEQNQNVSYGFAATWQGKRIPNWTYYIAFANMDAVTGPGNLIFDWHASIGS